MAAPKPKKDAGPQTFEVLSPLRLDDTRYEPGDTVDMAADDAQELVDAEVLRPTKAASKPTE